MAISAGPGGEDKPMSDINTTPLVDVMLVLLIIFLIAIPVVVHTVKLELPKVAFVPTTTKPENLALSVTNDPAGNCLVYWNLTKVDATKLSEIGVKKLKEDVEKAGGVANMKPEDIPEVHIRGDINTPWRCIGGVIYTMQQAGFPKVGFISSPDPADISITRL